MPASITLTPGNDIHTAVAAGDTIDGAAGDDSITATTAAGLMAIDVHGPNAVAMSDILF